MRLDKWLWAARFYKTRQMAAEAVKGGHVHLNSLRTKPGKEIHIGSRLQITKASLSWDIQVVELPRQRRPASEAIHFYEESDESQSRRQEQVRLIREERAASPIKRERKPNKRDRRLIHRFKQKS